MKKKRIAPEDPTLRELDAIKRLLILLLVKSGAAQGEIAMALDVDQATVSRMFPARRVRRFGKQNDC